ncbi:MAG TPA: hypothetical protein VK419_06940 [Bryobacteraceae bacterium]|nr:hypothetical protein [Bryobacteraceae bacterium]
MTVRLALVWIALPVLAQTAQDEDYHVYTDAPRLILTKQRLRLLQRERERESMRWQQFDALVSGGAPMPEPGFAWALYYQVARNDQAGRKAVDWALGDANDLRQLALVFDWCAPVMTKAQSDRLAEKIQRMTSGPADDVRRQRDRALGVIAIADRLPDHGEKVMSGIINDWWRGGIVKRIEAGAPPFPREQTYALYEMMHAIRDNLKIDLRESATDYFATLAIDHLCGHYPSPFQAPENDYRVPVYVRNGEPDITDAAMSRAAEMAMVAYDDNALDSQYLQGWLMQDRFLMRGALGAVYEFLWANPYQPGLSYFHMPLVFHDASTGHVFARTSWDEDATWVGYFEGHLQLFKNGQVETLRAGASTQPVHIGDALILSAENQDAWRFRADAEAVFVLNLAPRAHYDVEINDEELEDIETDAGGTLVLSFPEGADSGVRIRRRSP